MCNGWCLHAHVRCSRVNPSLGHGQVQAVFVKYPYTYVQCISYLILFHAWLVDAINNIFIITL